MRAFLSVLGGMFRPAKGFDAAGAAVKWLWIPLALILVGSVALKVTVATPMQSKAQQAQAEAMLQKEMESWPEDQKAQYDKDMAAAKASGDFTPEEAMATAGGITSIANLVFGMLGAVVAILYIATYFFVAAKTWANPVAYTTMLTAGALSLLPHAIRNVIQAIYMASSGVWLQYPGLGALVAPADPTQAPGLAYAILSQVDIFVIWGLLIMLGVLTSKAVGITKKRVIPAFAVFIGITAVLQAVPTLVTSVFMGASGRG